ncbi:MAG: fibronectin type III domain-containing protein [Anaerovoracaceae bacterium]
MKRKILAIMMAVALLLTIMPGVLQKGVVKAEDTTIVLTVVDESPNPDITKSYTLTELKALNQVNLRYTSYNRAGTWGEGGFPRNVEGPLVSEILINSGIQVENILNSDYISFISGDGSKYAYNFQKSELFADRYFFPAGSTGTENGNFGAAAAQIGMVKREPIINLSYMQGTASAGQLVFGQSFPNEQNEPFFNKGMIAHENDKSGNPTNAKIVVSSNITLPTCEAPSDAVPSNISKVSMGSSMKFEKMPKSKAKVYYTTDLKIPNRTSKMYNYADSMTPVPEYNIPFDKAGVFVIKAIASDITRLDSPVSTFTYDVIPWAPKNFAVASAYNSAELVWTQVAGTIGYNVYRSTSATGTFSKINNDFINVGSYYDLNLKTGSTYFYKVEAVANGMSDDLVSPQTAAVSATPVLSKATLSSVKRSSKTSIKVSWKKTTGATGYELYMKTGSGKYKSIKDTKSLSYKKTKLKKGKAYTFKVKAYIKVDGKKIYGAYSGSKKLKLK